MSGTKMYLAQFWFLETRFETNIRVNRKFLNSSVHSVALVNQRSQTLHLLCYFKILVRNIDTINAITHPQYGNKMTPAVRQTIHATTNEVVTS
jgi:hypothetical protein